MDLNQFRYRKIVPGDKIYAINRDTKHSFICNRKTRYRKRSKNYWNHIDSPRLDLNQTHYIEDDNMGYFKTHYYGGIKNINGHYTTCYVWVVILKWKQS